MAFWRRNDAKRVAYGRICIAMRNYTLHAKLKEFFFENFECQNLMSLVCFAHPCKTRRGYAKIKLQRNILRSTLHPYTKLTKSMRKGVLKFSWKNKYQGSSLKRWNTKAYKGVVHKVWNAMKYQRYFWYRSSLTQ